MPKKENKKQHILETSLKLFAENGYASTPISLIAKTAKVSQGLMYNFFPGKEELLKEIIHQGSNDIAESMKSYEVITDPKEAIRNHVKATVKIIAEKKEFWRLLHALRLQPGVLREVDEQFARITMTVTATFEKVFRKLDFANPKLESILFLTQIDGLVLLYLQNDSIPIKKLADQLINRYAS